MNIEQQNKYDKWEIDHFIRDIASNYNYTWFYPNLISKNLNIKLNNVLIRLDELTKNAEYLELMYEIRCNNNHIIYKTNNYSTYLFKNIYCKECKQITYIDLNHIYPYYKFTNGYLDALKRNNKKKEGN